MDTLATSTPSIPPQPAAQPPVSSPPESPNRRRLLWLGGSLAVLTLGIAIGVFGVKFLNHFQGKPQINTYEDCLAAKGSVIQESYPAVCVTKDGQRFVQQISGSTSETDKNTEICNINQEYQNTAVNPIICQCPDGHEWKILSTSFGPCPAGQARDCPQTLQKCSPKN